VDLPAIEREILARWADRRIPARAREQTAGARPWTCYEPPAAAHGLPGLQHVGAFSAGDALSRFKTMQGYHVPRRSGWDCHGLTVEVAAERELGLAGPADIEGYGVAAFTARCRESALRHAGAFTQLASRLGCWPDPAAEYRTMDRAYIEAVWSSLRRLFGRGLLVREERVSPYCPRCATVLSAAEMARPEASRRVTDVSVLVRFRLTALPPDAERELAGADLLAATADPWMLARNTALVVDPDMVYAVARRSGHRDRVVLAADLIPRVLGAGWHAAALVRGADLAGCGYELPFRSGGGATGRVVTRSLATARDGTGLVPLAPAFGADDLAAPLRPDGRFAAGVPLVGGLFFRDAGSRLVADLGNRGRVLRSQPLERDFPHCWRCGTPVLDHAAMSWLIRAPAGDWAVSRSRYWGTPLPVWTCPAGHAACVGSLAELSALAGRDVTGLDPHRPQLDDVEIGCPDCGAAARRVPEVIDAGYDAGAMPFAQLGAPAQLACAGGERARDWLAALDTIGTLGGAGPAYASALVTGLMTDARGVPMSGRRGNVRAALPVLESCGADAVRWFCCAAALAGGGGEMRAPDEEALGAIVGRILAPYWESASFLAGAAGADAGSAGWRTSAAVVRRRPALDRWLLSELHGLVRDVTGGLEEFELAPAARRIARFVGDLRWYVGRSAARFAPGGAAADRAAAGATLAVCLGTLTRLMAPVTPFLADYVWGLLPACATDAEGGAADSVHLASWPAVDPGLIS
jgi:isoleucyl-tRNA synthetase